MAETRVNVPDSGTPPQEVQEAIQRILVSDRKHDWAKILNWVEGLGHETIRKVIEAEGDSLIRVQGEANTVLKFLRVFSGKGIDDLSLRGDNNSNSDPF